MKKIDGTITGAKKEDLFKGPDDQIVFLENIRFYKEEEKNNTSFAKQRLLLM